MTDTEKAYLAGLFDGEGTLGYYFKTSLGHYLAQVAIYNADPRVMSWIAARLPFGRVAVTNNKRGKHRVCVWSVKGRRHVELFLRSIRPYLVIKADQVDLLFSLWEAELEIKTQQGKKLPEQVVLLRQRAGVELKALKTASFLSLH